MTRSVHPSFDTKTETWFTTERGLRAEAPRLAALQKKLGADVQIEGYYPSGYHGSFT